MWNKSFTASLLKGHLLQVTFPDPCVQMPHGQALPAGWLPFLAVVLPGAWESLRLSSPALWSAGTRGLGTVNTLRLASST